MWAACFTRTMPTVAIRIKQQKPIVLTMRKKPSYKNSDANIKHDGCVCRVVDR